MNTVAIKDQAIGSAVKYMNDLRAEDLEKVISQINASEKISLTIQDSNLVNALAKMSAVQDFVNTPDHILGSVQTKHGEIAEQVEVGITNARQALRGLADRATFDGVGRLAPEDYLLDGNKVQSKFINGELNTLKHVFQHLENYKGIGFARGDGSFYHIPKDQFENIMKIMKDGELDGRASKSVAAILREIEKIEHESGQKFTDIIKAADVNYDDVQLGKISDTLDSLKKEIAKENDEIVKDIKDSNAKERETAQEIHKPSLGEATKVAAVAAAVSGGMTLILDIHKKKKEGKKISDFSTEDWKEIGLDTGAKALKGGVTGYAVYGLTNLANMPSPVASGLVSATFGMTSLINDYRKGNLAFEDFIEESETLCLDTGLVMIGSLIGQAFIPIPVLGSVIGSIVSNIVLDVAKGVLAKHEMVLLDQYKARCAAERSRLEQEVKDFIDRIVEKYKQLGGILQIAFDKEINVELRFEYSQRLALAYGIPEAKILKNKEEIDDFFLN